MKIKTIFIGRRPARVTPRNQGGGRAKRLTCQGLIEVGGGEVSQILKFGGLARHSIPSSASCCEVIKYAHGIGSSLAYAAGLFSVVMIHASKIMRKLMPIFPGVA